MLRPIIKFDTGLVIEANKDGFEIETPDGEYVEYDAYGMRKLQEDELGACVNVGDYIEHFPMDDYVVISCMDSGYRHEQKIDVGNANLWRVIKIEDEIIFAVSAKSVGELKLEGYAGYQNCEYVLRQISDACTTYISNGAAVLGADETVQPRVYLDDITKVSKRLPYFDEAYKEHVELIKQLGLKGTNGIWLASRHLTISSGDYYFGVNVLKNNGEVRPEVLNKSYIAGCLDVRMSSYDVFPVICFKLTEKVEAGAGTEDDPYKLLY